jgi:transketolase
VEAASVFGWERIVGSDGLSIGIDRFGASAPAEVLAEKFGFTPEAVADKVRGFLG